MCPHTSIYVSSHLYICVLVTLASNPEICRLDTACPRTSICVLVSYVYIRVLVPLYVSSSRMSIYVSSCLYMCPRLVRLYMCPRASICILLPTSLYMTSYMCPRTSICVLIPLYLCPYTSLYVSSYLYICPPHSCSHKKEGGMLTYADILC
jgi:hypothetical protein